MNIIFLDFDGVLNSWRSHAAFRTLSRFDPIAVGLVKSLCTQAKALIVVSSSWRIGHTVESIKVRMNECGASSICPYVTGMTPYSVSLRTRGEEIAKWVSKHELDRYVILDDDSDMHKSQPLIQTTMWEGLMFKHYLWAIEILNPDYKIPEEFRRIKQ